MRLAWVTDPHFDHAKLDVWQRWSDELLAEKPSAIVVTGDLSEGDDVPFQLRRMAETFDCPIYFVLGNHDFYGSRIDQVRRNVLDLSRQVEHLVYLTDSPCIAISDRIVLIGDDGWGDATVGDYENSRVKLNDFALIEDFQTGGPKRWKQMLIDQGQQSAMRLAAKLNSVPRKVTDVLIATHVPPFRESCWYEGHTTDDHWAPFFVCGQVGEVILAAATMSPNRRFTVLCGHTHHAGIATIRENLIVHTGSSQYGDLTTEAMVEQKGERLEVKGNQVRR